MKDLQAAAQEAVGAEQGAVAICALLELQKMFDESPDCEPAPGDRAVVVCNIVKIIQEASDQPPAGKPEDAAAGSHAPGSAEMSILSTLSV